MVLTLPGQMIKTSKIISIGSVLYNSGSARIIWETAGNKFYNGVKDSGSVGEIKHNAISFAIKIHITLFISSI